MNLFRNRTVGGPLVFGFLLAACGDVAHLDEAALHIHPADDESLGRIQVNTPPGWVLPINPNDDGTASYRGQALALNQPLRLTAGTGCVSLTSKFDAPLSVCGINVDKTQLTQLNL